MQRDQLTHLIRHAHLAVEAISSAEDPVVESAIVDPPFMRQKWRNLMSLEEMNILSDAEEIFMEDVAMLDYPEAAALSTTNQVEEANFDGLWVFFVVGVLFVALTVATVHKSVKSYRKRGANKFDDGIVALE